MVLYPEQTSKSNSQRCWNWFEPDHQQLDQGEPGMIAALTRHVLAGDHKGRRADPARVYVAGLSAGGAMAAVVAGLYPDIFAAVGVHSGLPSGAAQDLMSAFGAMRRGAKGQATPPMPTIVFHGSADTTVHPRQRRLRQRCRACSAQGVRPVAGQKPQHGGRRQRAAHRARGLPRSRWPFLCRSTGA